MGKQFSGEQLELFELTSDFREAYGIDGGIMADFVWADSKLRELLWRKYIFSEVGKIRARMRSEKMSARQRSDSARHAAQARWARSKVISTVLAFGNGNGRHDNGHGNGVAANGGAL
jgi:hypothetical protein